MQIYGPQFVHGPQGIQGPHLPRTAPSSPAPQGVEDELSISDVARFVEMAKSLPEIRTEKVQAAREALARGEYDSPERLQAALERMLDELM